MIDKTASVHWEGSGKKGLGQISTETGALQGDVFVIDRFVLTLKASVPGIDEARFQEIAASAKRDCPVSKALAGVAEISMQATLDNAVSRDVQR